MKWSFSQHGAFRKCQRQWFYKYVYANALAKDPGRQEAQRLSNLVNLKAWRGKIVDAVISKIVVSLVERKPHIDLATARQIAWNMFQDQQRQGLQNQLIRSQNFPGFLEVEYGTPLTPEEFNEAWEDIQQALAAFFKSSYVWDTLKQAQACIVQRRIPFNCNGANLIAVPDVVCFYRNKPPFIMDWKVQSNPVGNYWIQLALYALALTRCKPHRDWPDLPPTTSPSDIGLAEVQLLTDIVRMHTVTEEEIEDLEEMIAQSLVEMSIARGERMPNGLHPEEFPTANSPGTCHYCPFKKLCWVVK